MVAWRVAQRSGLVNQEPDITFVYMADTVILRQRQQLIRVKKYGNKYRNLLKRHYRVKTMRHVCIGSGCFLAKWGQNGREKNQVSSLSSDSLNPTKTRLQII